MSIWQCAASADREVKSSLDTLCLSEADTWSKLSCAMMSQHALQSNKSVALSEASNQRRLEALMQDADRKVNLINTLSEQLNETKEANAELVLRVQALTKQLEVCEANNVTLTKEKAGITKELVLAQNTVRKLYKDSQSKKNNVQPTRNLNELRQQTNSNLQGSLLAPPGLWHLEDTRIKVKEPVFPKFCPPPVVLPETPPHQAPPAVSQPTQCVSDTGGVQTSVEVVVEKEEVAPRKKADRRAGSSRVTARSKRGAQSTDKEKPAKEKPSQSGEEKRVKRTRSRNVA